jgi:hypothetical protein
VSFRKLTRDRDEPVAMLAVRRPSRPGALLAGQADPWPPGIAMSPWTPGLIYIDRIATPWLHL